MQRVGGALAAVLLLGAGCSGDDAGEPAPAAAPDTVERGAAPDNGNEAVRRNEPTIPAPISPEW